MKPFYTSKTLWFNVVAVVVFALGLVLDAQDIFKLTEPQITALGIVIAVGNAVLRLTTGKAIMGTPAWKETQAHNGALASTSYYMALADVEAARAAAADEPLPLVPVPSPPAEALPVNEIVKTTCDGCGLETSNLTGMNIVRRGNDIKMVCLVCLAGLIEEGWTLVAVAKGIETEGTHGTA